MKHAVIGLSFGDEGKGKVVSYLCSQSPKPDLVIRYCGGQQAGHQVIIDGTKHVFSNFGSGTLQNIPTYWSQFCTIDPIGILVEYDLLKAKGVKPTLFVDSRCPITTPFDKNFNCNDKNNLEHGTCGVGVGQTWQREQDHFSLTINDLQYPWIFREKLRLIATKYYNSTDYSLAQSFAQCCLYVTTNRINIVNSIPDAENIIFEGSQGLLLDPDIGFFPHVTRSNIGLKNIIKLLDGKYPDELWLVTRAYQTRHGNGPMSNEYIPLEINNPYEHNLDTGYQGKFRTAPLDLDLLKYAITKEVNINNIKKKRLVITCIDAIKNFIFTKNSKIHTYNSQDAFISAIISYLEIDCCKFYISDDPFNNLSFIGEIR